MKRGHAWVAAALLVAAACSGAGRGGSARVSTFDTVHAAAGVAVDAHGRVLVADQAGNRVLRDGAPFAGIGVAGFGGDDGPAAAATLNGPTGVAVAANGDVYVADQGNNRLRRIDSQGRIRTVAGTSEVGTAGDGEPAVAAVLRAPSAVAVGADGAVYFTQPDRVRRIGSDGRISTVLGGGVTGLERGDAAQATAVDLGEPAGIAVGRDGTLFVAVPASHWVLATRDGQVRVVAGNRGDDGLQDYDGQATDAVLHGPTGLATDRHGNLFVTEPEAHRVRRIDAKGAIRTVLPDGRAGIDAPEALAVTPGGDLVVADPGNHRVDRVSGTAGRDAGPPTPVIDAMSPSQGSASGDTAVVIRGRGFTLTGATVRFGHQAARIVHASATSLLVVAPAERPGATVNVAVSTRSGTSPANAASRYTYVPGWEPTGALATPRLQHTATLLPDGGVLVAGGNDAFCITCHPLASAELYDPAMGMWRPTGSMSAGRMEHTATLLGTGEVLVTGGKATGPGVTDPLYTPNALASAELYDPATGLWRPTGSMAAGRFGHTASLLADGRVLVAGGAFLEFGRRPLGSAEVYDPATGQWSPTGRLAQARGSHTATVLADGRVLVVGGLGGEEFPPEVTTFPAARPLASAELYDPASGTWAPTGDMAVARYGHTATLLPNGKVLVVGGFAASGVPLRSAELFDPVSGRWSPAAVPRAGHAGDVALLLPRGVVLVAGGGPLFEDPRARPDAVAEAELYDPAANTWTPTRVLATARSAAAAVVLRSGAALVVGGGGVNDDPAPQASPPPLASAEVYR